MLNRINFVISFMVITLLCGCEKPTDNDTNFNTGEAITIDDCKPVDDLVLKNHSDGVDYIIDCDLRIEKAGLIIEAGTTILFESDSGIIIDDNGFIEANGNASNVITFSSATKLMGAWKGIEITTNDVRNSLQACIVEYAGEANEIYPNNKCAILIDETVSGAKVSINQCIIRHSSNFGIFVDGNSDLISFANNTISNTKKASVSAQIKHLTSIKGDNKFLESDEFDGVVLRWTTIKKEENIIINGIKVLFLTDSTLRGPLTISAGSEIVMGTDVEIVVTGNSPNNGRMIANGTASQPIIIRGQEPISGFWAGILLQESTLNNSFSYVKLSDGGGRKIKGTLTFQEGIANLVVGQGFFGEATKITLTNCEINNSADCGVYVASNSTYTPSNVSYSNNSEGNICNE